MAPIRNKRQAKRDFRYYLRCPRCGAVSFKFSDHFKSCEQSAGENYTELKRRAQDDANKLLKRVNLKRPEFKRICGMKGARNRWVALRESLLRTGLHFKGGDDSSDEDEDEEEDGTEAAARPRKVGKTSQLLKESLAMAEDPKIIDPSTYRNYQRESVKSSLQEAGLYRRFGNNSRFLIRYRHHRLHDQHAADEVVKQEVEYCARLLGYLFEKLKLKDSLFNSDDAIARSLKLELVGQFFDECKDCGQSGQTISSMEKAYKALANFLRNHCDLAKESRDDVKVFFNHIKSRGKGTNKEILKGNAAKKAKRFGDENVMLEDIRQLLENEKTIEMLHSAADRLKSPEGEGKIRQEYENAYQFLVQYCICSLCLYSGQRSQVPRNMTLAEYQEKLQANEDEPAEEPVYTVYLHEHKNKAGGDHKVAILERHAKWFDFYIENCRNANSTEKELFLGYRSGKRLTNVPTMIKQFQQTVGAEKVFTTTEIRHIIETNAETLLHGDLAAAQAIHRALGHTGEVARRYYVDPRPQPVIHGVKAMKRLKKADSAAEGPVKTRSRLVKPAGSIPLVSKSSEFDNKVSYLKEKYLSLGCDSVVPTKSELYRDETLACRDQVEANRFYDKIKNMRNDLRIEALGKILKYDYDAASADEQADKDHWIDMCEELAGNRNWTGIQWKRSWNKFQRAVTGAQTDPGLYEDFFEETGVDEDEEREQQEPGSEMQVDYEETAFENFPFNEPVSDDTDVIASSQHTYFEASDDEDEPVRVQASVKPKKPPVYSRLYQDGEKINYCDDQQWPNLIIKKTKDRGRGVFAGDQGFPSHQLICDYHGIQRKRQDHIEDLTSCTDIEEYDLITSYALDLDQFKAGSANKADLEYTIEAHIDDGSYGRLINHCIDGHSNVKPYLKFIEGRRVVLFYSVKKIDPGEELLWHYGSHFQDKDWFNNCPCKNCLKKGKKK